ncbi:threonine dehydratase [Exophiala viscosa]|uniref:Threonine dehydratase n=1 Tax=Exophiala viscosa TaxID=2486360 RepID=A0AAN6DPP1_9EURO|nr:threonine dehydratase [Exophiala viscosa]KAI1620906.1 threonine dehydratase [Exophiala viscosa]
MADPSTCPPLIPSSIATAYQKITPYIHKTPVITSSSLDAIASSPNPAAFLSENPPTFEETAASVNRETTPRFRLHFKCENFQRIGAFKARGGFHAVTRLIDEMGVEEVRRRGVVTHSSGNHAQALALAASTFNIPSYIVMPKISTPSKIAGTKLYTSNVIFSGSTSQEREAVVADVIEEHGAILVPPYDHPDIILGQGTVGLELEEQIGNSKLDAVMTPLGGGGLLSGVATWFSDKETLVFGAEPSFQGGDDGRRGLLEGKRIEHVSTLTIADGLRTPVGFRNWEVLSDRRKLEGVFAVSEEQIKMAMRLVLERLKVVVEPSGCVPLAVVLFNQEFREMVAQKQIGMEKDGWDIGIVFSGGNTTVKAISKLFGEDEAEDDGKREAAKVAMDGGTKVEDVAG